MGRLSRAHLAISFHFGASFLEAIIDLRGGMHVSICGTLFGNLALGWTPLHGAQRQSRRPVRRVRAVLVAAVAQERWRDLSVNLRTV